VVDWILMRKIFLGLVFYFSLMMTNNLQAKWFGFGESTMYGCIYDELGRKVDCVKINFMGKTGLTYSDAERICLDSVRNMAAEKRYRHEAATGGCI